MRHLITTLLFAFLSAPALALTPYTAVYDAKGRGLSATNHTTLSPADSSGRIEYRSISKARGLARLFKHDPIVEYTQFEEIDGEYRAVELSGEPARLHAAVAACRLVAAGNGRLQQKRS